jgi:hypothetical protein
VSLQGRGESELKIAPNRVRLSGTRLGRDDMIAEQPAKAARLFLVELKRRWRKALRGRPLAARFH